MRYTLAPGLEALAAAMPSGQLAGLSADTIAAARLRNAPAPSASAEDDRITVEDRCIPGPPPDGPPVGVRLYRPRRTGGTLAGLLYMHGGGFCFGDLDSEHARLSPLAADHGLVIVSVDYRLAPEHPYPAGLQDCYAALLWMASRSAGLGVDTDRLAVGGASAGGCLAAALSLMARDRHGPALRYQWLIYPCLDDRLDSHSMGELRDAPIISAADIAQFWRLYLGRAGGDNVPAYAAPARAAFLSGLPPAFIMAAEFDPLRDEALHYASRLEAAGIDVESHLIAGAIHGFDILGPNPSGLAALCLQNEALARALS